MSRAEGREAGMDLDVELLLELVADLVGTLKVPIHLAHETLREKRLIAHAGTHVNDESHQGTEPHQLWWAEGESVREGGGRRRDAQALGWTHLYGHHVDRRVIIRRAVIR